MKIYKLLMLEGKPFDYENLISCELNSYVLSDTNLTHIRIFGADIAAYNGGILTIYFDYDTASDACSNPKFKKIIKTYNRINKLNELNENI